MKAVNILYIHSHDTGRYIQPYGHAVPTPRLQKFAEEGVLFRQAFCAGPTCSPSRAGLLTGQAAHSSGMLGLAHRGWKLKDDFKQHIIHTLHKYCYDSALSGVQHIASPSASKPEEIGYKQILKTENHESAHIASVGADYIRSEHSAPWFLSVGFFDTHRDFAEHDAEDDPRFCMPPATLPDNAQTRRDMADFKSSARRYDTAVGMLLDALAQSGQAENTLVICTTDHGIAFPGLKCSLTDHGIGVMLLMRGPEGFSGGKIIDGMVSHIDVFPTICEVLDIDKPEWLQGKSVMPLVRGDAEEINEEIFSEVTYHAAYEPKRCVRTKRWKYIRRFHDDRETPTLPNCDNGFSKAVWMENGWKDHPVEQEYLFDLVFDPNEANNLASDPAYAKQKEELSKRLTDWMERTDDPLLNGPVPLSEWGITTLRDALNPEGPLVDCKGQSVE